jgi:uncharacterized repeat protein (TIGR03803 family)
VGNMFRRLNSVVDSCRNSSFRLEEGEKYEIKDRYWRADRTIGCVVDCGGAIRPAKPAREQPGSPMFKTLLNFNNAEGAGLSGALAQGTDGDLYGTTVAGGLYNQGTVFKITPAGTQTILYNFCAQTNCPDGDDPSAAQTLGTDGNFYGTTYLGGAHADACRAGCGVVFKIIPMGAMTTLYSFCAQPGCADGAGPGALVQGSDGNFYGITEQGGSNTCVNTCGTVFKITPAGVLTTLYKFTSAGGYDPDVVQSLVQATDGNFYGTTVFGGSGSGCLRGGCGTAFRITPEGALTTLYNFQGGAGESENPGGLVQATDGDFYGVSGGGHFGPNCVDSCGTVFKMTSEGVVTTLVSLHNNEGAGPMGLVQATDGNFYVAADAGGLCNCGTIFEVTPGVRVDDAAQFQRSQRWLFSLFRCGSSYQWDLLRGYLFLLRRLWRSLQPVCRPWPIRRVGPGCGQDRSNCENSGKQSEVRHRRHV